MYVHPMLCMIKCLPQFICALSYGLNIRVAIVALLVKCPTTYTYMYNGATTTTYTNCQYQYKLWPTK